MGKSGIIMCYPIMDYQEWAEVQIKVAEQKISELEPKLEEHSSPEYWKGYRDGIKYSLNAQNSLDKGEQTWPLRPPRPDLCPDIYLYVEKSAMKEIQEARRREANSIYTNPDSIYNLQ